MADVYKGMHKQAVRAASWKKKQEEAAQAADMSGSKKTLKSQIRGLKRLLNSGTLDPKAKKDKIRLLRKMEERHAEKRLHKKEQNMSSKYHKIKFFERQKAERKLKQATAALKHAPEGTTGHAAAAAAVAEAQADLRYIKWYPKAERYISMYADGTAKRPKKAEFMRFWALLNAADRDYLSKQEAAEAWVAAGHEPLRGMQAEGAAAPAAGKASQPRATRQRAPKPARSGAAQASDETDDDSDSASSTGSSCSGSGSDEDDAAPAAAPAPPLRARAKKPARTVEPLPAQAESLLHDEFFAGLGTAEPDIAAADMQFMAEAAPGSSAGSEDEDEEGEAGAGHYRPREWKPGAFVKQREERQYKHAGRYRDSAAARRQTDDAEDTEEYAPRRSAGGRQHQQFSESGRPPARGARGGGPSAGMKRGRDRAPAQFDRYQLAEARHAAARGASSRRAHMTFDAEEPSSHRAASRPARLSSGHRVPRDTSAASKTTHFDNFQPPEARHAAARGPAAPRQHMTFD